MRWRLMPIGAIRGEEGRLFRGLREVRGGTPSISYQWIGALRGLPRALQHLIPKTTRLQRCASCSDTPQEWAELCTLFPALDSLQPAP